MRWISLINDETKITHKNFVSTHKIVRWVEKLKSHLEFRSISSHVSVKRDFLVLFRDIRKHNFNETNAMQFTYQQLIIFYWCSNTNRMKRINFMSLVCKIIFFAWIAFNKLIAKLTQLFVVIVHKIIYVETRSRAYFSLFFAMLSKLEIEFANYSFHIQKIFFLSNERMII